MVVWRNTGDVRELSFKVYWSCQNRWISWGNTMVLTKIGVEINITCGPIDSWIVALKPQKAQYHRLKGWWISKESDIFNMIFIEGLKGSVCKLPPRKMTVLSRVGRGIRWIPNDFARVRSNKLVSAPESTIIGNLLVMVIMLSSGRSRAINCSLIHWDRPLI